MPSTGLDIVTAARRFRAALVARDDQALARIAHTYLAVEETCRREISRLTADLQTLPAGEPVPISWLYRRDRLESIRRDITREVERITPALVATMVGHAEAAATSGAHDALDLINRSAGTRFTHQGLHLQRAVQIVGQTTSPALRGLTAELPAGAGDAVAAALERGVTLGRSPVLIGRDMMQAVGGNKARAQTIARTEALRAYREVSRAAWIKSRVVHRWQWFSTLDRTACPVCIAMHGTIHPATEPMATHPSCRCTPIPIPDNTDPPITTTGPDEFETWTYERQRTTLGPGKHDAWLGGRITLRDLVAVDRHPRWGLTRRERSLTDALRRADGPHTPPPAPSRGASFLTPPVATTRMAGLIRTADEGLHRVMASPPDPPMVKVGSRTMGARGSYDTRSNTISVSPHLDDRQTIATLYHEYGHHLDATLAPPDSKRGLLTTNPEESLPLHWRVFFNTAMRTDTINNIRMHAPDRKYLLNLWEVWARAFAQYAAEKSDPDLFRDIVEGRVAGGSVVPRHWDDTEWGHVSRAVRIVLRREKWDPGKKAGRGGDTQVGDLTPDVIGPDGNPVEHMSMEEIDAAIARARNAYRRYDPPQEDA